MVIDTQSPQYQQYLNGIDTIGTYYAPRLKLFAKLPVEKKKLWLQKDPLLRKLLKLSYDLHECEVQI